MQGQGTATAVARGDGTSVTRGDPGTGTDALCSCAPPARAPRQVSTAGPGVSSSPPILSPQNFPKRLPQNYESHTRSSRKIQKIPNMANKEVKNQRHRPHKGSRGRFVLRVLDLVYASLGVYLLRSVQGVDTNLAGLPF